MKKSNKLNIILDTDPGVDDALGMFFLSQSKKVNIRLVVASAGNKGVKTTTKNCAYLINRFKLDAKLASGSEEMLKRKFIDAGNIHGENGLGGLIFNHVLMPVATDYIEEIKKVLDEFENVVYVCFGPMTNLAFFLKKYPKYKKKFKEIIFMGGVKDKVIKGSVYKEFNVGVDPEAVELVLKSKIPLTVVPCDLGHIAYLTQKDLKKIEKFGNIGADFKSMFANYHDRSIPEDCIATHDSCAALYLTTPQMFKAIDAFVKVQYFSEIETGCLTSLIHSKKKANAKLVVDINVQKFKRVLFKFLKLFEE